MSTTYLTGVSSPAIREAAAQLGLGVLLQPETTCYVTHLADYPGGWGMDNGCFGEQLGRGKPFDGPRYLRQLAELAEAALVPARFATAPDVIGDAQATLERSRPFFEAIRALGYPVALVGQPGAEDMLLPWDDFDVVFLGGDDAWKEGDGARRLAARALKHGKAVHMGRVNSGRRFRIAIDFGCETADGTFLGYGPRLNLPRLSRWPGIAA